MKRAIKKTSDKGVCYKLPPEVVTLMSDDQTTLVVHSDNNKFFYKIHGVVAGEVFEWLCSGRSVDWITEKLTKKYKDVPASRLKADIKGLTKQLLKNKLIVLEKR